MPTLLPNTTTGPRALRAFAFTALAFLSLDAVWLSITGSRLYRPVLGALMRPDVDLLAAALFYLVYLAGLVRFAILPSRSVRDAVLQGACFGLVAYATYDLTNQATLVAWRWHVTVIDLLWGSTASAIAGGVGWRFGSTPR